MRVYSKYHSTPVLGHNIEYDVNSYWLIPRIAQQFSRTTSITSGKLFFCSLMGKKKYYVTYAKSSHHSILLISPQKMNYGGPKGGGGAAGGQNKPKCDPGRWCVHNATVN